MKTVIYVLMVTAMSFAAVAEQEQKQEQKQEQAHEKIPKAVEVKASDYNIRVGEELRNFGWKILNHGTKFCDYRGAGTKHLIRADLFENRRCPDKLIGVKKLTSKTNAEKA